MSIDHLIVDSSGFIHNGPIRETGKEIYSCQDVLDEIKDQATRDRLRFLPFEMKLIQYDREDLEFCSDFAKKTGDFRQLSVVDLKLIAATYRLEKKFNGTKFINTTPKPIVIKTGGTSRKKGPELPDDWMTPDNINDFIKPDEVDVDMEEQAGSSLTQNRVTVACMTSDFSIQNCLLQMGLHVVSPVDGLMIKEAKRIALRCHACFKVYPDPSKIKNDFCPHCGNLDTLKRVQYIIDDKGAISVKVNLKKPIKVKGTNQQLPRPKGGKHANNPILAPDQRVRKDKTDKFTTDDKKNLTPDHILFDPAYLVRTNPFALRSVKR